MSKDQEVWLPLAGSGPKLAERYEVSNQGRIRSRDHWVVRPRSRPFFKKGRILALYTNPKGYQRLRTRSGDPGDPQTLYVHSAVLSTFVGPRPEGLVACHNDGNPGNNRVENLRWDTPSENSHDVVRHGRHTRRNRDRCRRQHLLREPNLLPSPLRLRNSRDCWSCFRAGVFISRRTRAGKVAGSMQEVSDRYYATLVFPEEIHEESAA